MGQEEKKINRLRATPVADDLAIARFAETEVIELQWEAPEMKLLLATLVNLVMDLSGDAVTATTKTNGVDYGAQYRAQAQQAAIEYVKEEGEDDWSLDWLCNHLGISADRFRQQALAGKAAEWAERYRKYNRGRQSKNVGTREDV